MDNTEPAGQSNSSGGLPKIVVILLVIILLIGAGVGAYIIFGKNLAKKQVTSTAQTAQAAPSPTSPSVITSIQAAIAGSTSLQCDFTDDTGRTIVSYIKAGKVRTDITSKDPKQSGSVIMKDKKLYFWNGTQGTEMAFDFSAAVQTITPPVTTGTQSKENPQNMLATMEKYKDSCKSASVDDALFTPPADVKFTDVSSMMNSMKATAPSRTMPSVIPSGMTEDQMKALENK